MTLVLAAGKAGRDDGRRQGYAGEPPPVRHGTAEATRTLTFPQGAADARDASSRSCGPGRDAFVNSRRGSKPREEGGVHLLRDGLPRPKSPTPPAGGAAVAWSP